MFIAISFLLAFIALVPAAGKLLGHPKMRASAAHFGIAWSKYRLIGVAEVLAAVGVLVGIVVHPLGVAAAAGLLLLLGGALVAHRRADDHPKAALPALVALGVTAAYLAAAATP